MPVILKARYGVYEGKSLTRLASTLSPYESVIFNHIIDNIEERTHTVILHHSMFNMSMAAYCKNIRLFKNHQIIRRLTRRNNKTKRVIPYNCHMVNPYFLIPKDEDIEAFTTLWDKVTGKIK